MNKFSDILKTYNDMMKKYGADKDDTIDEQKLASMVFINAAAIRRILGELAGQENRNE